MDHRSDILNKNIELANWPANVDDGIALHYVTMLDLCKQVGLIVDKKNALKSKYWFTHIMHEVRGLLHS